MLASALLVQAARAEMPPQTRDQATHVVTGVIRQLDASNSRFGNDGVRTEYFAVIAIEKVEKGKGLKVNDTIRVHWFQVTKRPSDMMPAGYGHYYPAVQAQGCASG